MARKPWNRRHGMAGTREYGVWWTMLMRCLNPKAKTYRHYGARGIRVCERWLRFDEFYADMGPRPRGGTIERINNDANYEPGNCRWATRKEQGQNKRNSRLLSANGRIQTMAEWAREIGVQPSAIHARIRLGWAIERAVTQGKPERPNAKLNTRKANEIRALYPRLTAQRIADKYDVSKKTILNIIHGKTFAED